MKRGVKALITIMIVFSMLAIILLASKFSLDADIKQKCISLENHIIAGQSGMTSAEIAFQASDFNAKCGAYVGAGNELTISSGN